MLELRYYHDKVIVTNSSGYIGILTLWSRVDLVIKRLGSIPTSVAAIANFYGDGLNQLLVNLLWNPQITKLYIVGTNRTGSLQELIGFFKDGVEQITINGSPQLRIRNTTRLLNGAITGPDLFSYQGNNYFPEIIDLTAGSIDEQITRLLDCLNKETKIPECPRQRLAITLLEPKVETFPSIVAGHQIISDNLLDAWRELLFTIHRFGLPTQLKKGLRKELLNLKVVITSPDWLTEEEYSKFNLDKKKLEAYCEAMLEADLAGDITYTYGHRLYKYFERDTIETVIKRLTEDKADRKCYIALWDTHLDLSDENPDGSPRGHPCWVGAYFRINDDKLALSVTFRTHRAYTGWIENAHGLMNLQKLVAKRLGIDFGYLTIFSHTISIDPDQLDLVKSIINGRKWQLRNDGRGEIVFSINDGKAVVEHKMSGILLKRYESANVEALGHQLAQDMVVSDLNHALYVGKLLGKIQMCLKHGLSFEES